MKSCRPAVLRFTAPVAAAVLGLAGLAVVAPASLAPASAAPCSNGGNGSSTGSLGNGSLGNGSLGNGSLGNGSLGGGSGSPQGPQGALPVYVTGTSQVISWVTGPRSKNRTFTRFGISGTDLGVAWDNGDGQTLMAFGDTFGDCTVAGQQWRHNVLLRTEDDDLSDGLTIEPGVPGNIRSGASVSADNPNFAREMVGSLGLDLVEITTIPTAAIAIGGKQYMNFMSVRTWGDAGHWNTNYSGIAVSGDNGQTWQPEISTFRINAGITVDLPDGLPTVQANNGKFQQSAYVRGVGDEDGWIYQFGTPNGRFGGAFLARFRPGDILDLGKYEYWAGKTRQWISDLNALPDYPESAVLNAPVSELSVAYSEYLDKYVMLYTTVTGGIVLRTAEHPEGEWSNPRTLVSPALLGMYGPMMLPTSPALTGSGRDLYFNASQWSGYNVMLIRSRLQPGW